MLEHATVTVIKSVTFAEATNMWRRGYVMYETYPEDIWQCTNDTSGKLVNIDAPAILNSDLNRLSHILKINNVTNFLIYTKDAINQIDKVFAHHPVFNSTVIKRHMTVSYENEMAIRISKVKTQITYNEATNSLEESNTVDGYIILDLVNGAAAFKCTSKGITPTEAIKMLKMSDKNMQWYYEDANDIIAFFNRPELTKFRDCSKILPLITGAIMAQECINFRENQLFQAYVLLMSAYPQMEIVYKMGMGHIIQSLLITTLSSSVESAKTTLKQVGKLIDIEKTEGKKMFRLPKYILNYLNTNKASINEYLAWSDIYALTNIQENEFNEFTNSGFLLSLIGNSLYYTYGIYNNLLNVLKYGYSLMKLAKYLRKEQADLYTLYDYLTMSEFCGLEYELYPQHLQDRHDKVSAYQRDRQNEIANNEIKKLAQSIEQALTVEKANNRTLSVIIPSKVDDFINEGNAMRNCMGSYYQNVLSGHSIIFYVRKSDEIDEPYIDAEYSLKYGLRQLYYKCNVPVSSAFERNFANKVCGIIQKYVKEGYIQPIHMKTHP